MSRRDQIRRRRLVALGAVAAVAVVVVAVFVVDLGPLGGDEAEEEVRETVERFAAAFGDGDFEAVCDLLTEQARANIAQVAAAVAGGGDASCPEVLRAGEAEQDSSGFRLEILRVRISGPQAAVETEVTRASGEPPEPRTLELERSEVGEWRLSGSLE